MAMSDFLRAVTLMAPASLVVTLVLIVASPVSAQEGVNLISATQSITVTATIEAIDGATTNRHAPSTI